MTRGNFVAASRINYMLQQVKWYKNILQLYTYYYTKIFIHSERTKHGSNLHFKITLCVLFVLMRTVLFERVHYTLIT